MNCMKIASSLVTKFQKYMPSIRHHSKESFLTGSSSQYVEDMYNAWLKDPSSVHVSWDSYFTSVTKSLQNAYLPPPNLAPPTNHNLLPLDDVLTSQFIERTPPSAAMSSRSASTAGAPAGGVLDDKTIENHLAVQAVIRTYQARGHLVAKLDPLEIMQMEKKSINSKIYSGTPPSEVLRNYKLEDMDKVYTLPQNTNIGGKDTKLPLREIIRRLEEVYCKHIGLEFLGIDNIHERQFLRQKMETPGVLNLSKEQKRLLLKRLIRTSEFENFLAKKWASEKRFGIEGGDTFIPGFKQIIDTSTELGVDHFFVGIAHRGRLNLLANVFRKPLYLIFNQFVPLEPADIGAGDVKYHYGSTTERTNRHTQKKYKLTLVANPSHLESVNAFILGRTRAEQVHRGDEEGKKIMAIIVHGDAAFCGQGVNYESLSLSYLPNYTTHGSICIIINNQVGFTTDPRFSRSSRYCSDLGHVVSAPIFHVNADDPESVVNVCRLAAEYRAQFHKDVIIDMVGYRRHGHNEADEPMFTQPLMYTKIHNTKPVAKKYREQLLYEKVVTAEHIKAVEDEYNKYCEDQYAKARQQTQLFSKDWQDSSWEAFYEGKDPFKVAPTGLPEAVIMHIAEKFSAPPPANLEFVIHKGIQRILSLRRKSVEQRLADWSLGEAFAIGSLVKEGFPVRLSGEDVERGTFSHRHHIIHHQKIDQVTYKALGDVYPNQATYDVCNSALSEFGVLGFEIGYAQANPNCLVLWEAQFGDFFNGAQIMFDQYLCSGETKWSRQNGIVILLPHGFEGMGSEHSSARIERFLQMCDDDPDVIPPFTPDFGIRQLHGCNWIIANCSTPGNMCHILRRQMYLPFRKPLIIFTPKSLLRLPACRSPFDEIKEGTEFRRVIPEEGEASKQPENVKKLMFCSGKVYYDIVAERGESKLQKEIAVSRVEQFSPFPYDLVKAECEKYAKAKLVWAQEEPKNSGGYSYVHDRLRTLVQGSRPVIYNGRPPAASPATGIKAQHIKEVEQLKKDFMTI